ncbi:SDR family NAD(P)-dependent oxidoreductase [Christiangramia flava]|mgnify:CR=1 FL=1|uniref:3-oxoacyl-[acyl-carrier protein] reductase n=1 Tax=Christiangramia flava JLT2011 TaxID=1229726 RepID=A0A1L7I0D3_9FLAO|nr:SDR family oxidoreductase [Christiangramia flava]APU67058.1 3-oxoacyl-[acyl-carrier protein] reductase [Christiangramia flava JLT2011]OSS38731.1 3-oxoacyl-[acyl-carrier protein] reductase [Christiangramia flava JLT2011]
MENKQVAIVTGANAGLGYATAKKLCDNGIITYVNGRNKEKTQQACEEFGPNARPFIQDLTKLKEIPAAVQKIYEETGRIDILVNNAGINMKKEFMEVTDEEFQNIIHTNITSVFVMSREVSKFMKEHQSGSIVNISSMAAQYGIPKVIAYTASKTAIEGMTRSMAVDLAQFGIRVNCVAPGFIKTNMSSKALDSEPERKQKVLSRTPMGRLGEPSDIADAVYYYASKESKFTTGTVLPVDGGNSIGF